MRLRRVVLLEPAEPGPEFRDPIARLKDQLARLGVQVGTEAGDGMVAVPGALRSLEQLFTDHLEGNDLPCGLLNSEGHFTGLLQAADDAVIDRFIRETQRGRLIVDEDPGSLLYALAAYRPPETRRQAGAGG